MAEGKKSFVLYCDLIHTVKQLPSDKAGNLFKHILSYVNDENPVTEDIIVKIAFEPIKQQLKRDLDKWDDIRSKRSEAGKASAEARAKKREQEETNSTSVKSAEQSSTNPTVNDNVNVNVTVSGNVNDNVTTIYNKKLTEVVTSEVPPNEATYFQMALNFHQAFRSVILKAKGSTKTIDRAKYKTWVDPIRLMIENDGITREQINIVGKYVIEDSFWRGNIQSTSKLREKFDKLIVQANERNSKNTGQQLSDQYKRELEERLSRIDTSKV